MKRVRIVTLGLLRAKNLSIKSLAFSIYLQTSSLAFSMSGTLSLSGTKKRLLKSMLWITLHQPKFYSRKEPRYLRKMCALKIFWDQSINCKVQLLLWWMIMKRPNKLLSWFTSETRSSIDPKRMRRRWGSPIASWSIFGSLLLTPSPMSMHVIPMMASSTYSQSTRNMMSLVAIEICSKQLKWMFQRNLKWVLRRKKL